MKNKGKPLIFEDLRCDRHWKNQKIKIFRKKPLAYVRSTINLLFGKVKIMCLKDNPDVSFIFPAQF